MGAVLWQAPKHGSKVLVIVKGFLTSNTTIAYYYSAYVIPSTHSCVVFEAPLYYVPVHLRHIKVFNNLKTKPDMEMKLASIKFFRQVAEGCRSSWLQILGNQLINHSPYTRYANHKYYLLYTWTH